MSSSNFVPFVGTSWRYNEKIQNRSIPTIRGKQTPDHHHRHRCPQNRYHENGTEDGRGEDPSHVPGRTTPPFLEDPQDRGAHHTVRGMKLYCHFGTDKPKAHAKLSGYHIPTRKQEIRECIQWLLMAFLSLVGFAMCVAILLV